MTTLSAAILAYTVYEKDQVLEAKKELFEIKREYQATLDILKKVNDFSPDDYDAIDNRAFFQARETVKVYKNLYIAKAIVATKSGTPEDALRAWQEAVYINPDDMLCNYGLGMEHFKSANRNNDKSHFEKAIKYLSHKNLSRHPQALYHSALSNLRCSYFQQDNKKNYEYARNAIDCLNATDKSSHPVGNIERNLALAYCMASKYSPNIALAKEYRDKSAKNFHYIQGLAAFSYFYDKYYNKCMELSDKIPE